MQQTIQISTHQRNGLYDITRQDGNGDAHLKAGIVGPSESIPIFILLVCLVFNINAQVIPSYRQVNWSDALLSYDYAVPFAEVNVMDFGAAADGITDDQPAVMSAIASLGGHAGYVSFPPGTYLMNASITLPDSVVLKGSSSDSSTLLFDFGGASQNGINMIGSSASPLIQMDEGYSKDSLWIITDSAFLFSPGDYAEILEENGSWDDQPVTWAVQSVGQIVQVDRVSGDTILLMSPLRITYDTGLDPRIRKIDPRVNAGVECLKIKRLDQSSSGANIVMSYAVLCRVRGVESDTSVSAHIDIFRSTRILIEGNYFHHAFEYDGASKHGYGVVINAHAGECLITNNIFRFLRHAMMAKTGANGNVFSYNYSREVHRSELPYDLGGDISLHGHYAFANLFEGNIVQNIMVDHYWGPSGPYNTFFRNRSELYGIIFSNGNPSATDSQHLIGNETTNMGFLMGQYSITGTGHIQHGNNIRGAITPAGTGSLSDTTYYLEDEPIFWNISDSWPSLGIPNTLGAGSNPARERWFAGGQYTVCPLRREWTGAVSSEWGDPHNWEPFGVPDEAAAVTIQQGAANDPQISSGAVNYIRSLILEENEQIELLNGSVLRIMK